MPKVYIASFRWVETPFSAELFDRVDKALDPVGDWFRYNGQTWYVATEHNAAFIYNLVRPQLQKTDSVVITKLDMGADYHGWAPKDLWNWLERYHTGEHSTHFRQMPSGKA